MLRSLWMTPYQIGKNQLSQLVSVKYISTQSKSTYIVALDFVRFKWFLRVPSYLGSLADIPLFWEFQSHLLTSSETCSCSVRKKMYNCAQLIFVLFLVSFVESKPVDNQNDLVGAFYYLNKYGYVPKDANKLTAALMSDDVVTQAVKDFQVLNSLEY